ncbi:MAG: PAS domain-containing protein [Myxococcales bacterium]|nr:PAS domain-containing protein [Myxococcales bacterium]
MPASLSDLFATALDPMLVLGHDHRITLASEGMRTALGRAPDDLIGEEVAALVHAADRQWIRASLTKLGRDAERVTFEGRMLHADGGARWTTWTFRRSPEGVVYGLGRDESVRRQVERLVRHREKRRKAMLDHAADPLVVLDADGKIADANAAAAHVFQIPPHALLGRPVADVLPAFAASRPAHGVPFETRVQGPDGPVDLEIRTNGFQFEDERMVVALARDVGRRKAHAEALASLSIRATLQNEAKSSFVAEMSHAMRTPLSAILGYTEMLVEDGDAREDVERIQAAARWLLDLTDDVLDLNRIEAGAFRMEPTPVDLDELVEDLRTSLPRMGALTVDLRATPPELVTDRARLRQILANLLTNASRRASTGVRLTVRDTEEDGRARVAFEVHDDGPGMAIDELQAAFEPFGTGGRGRERSAGLGLAIARRLAEALGGHLTAASRPGDGSVFTVFLPRASSRP